MVKNLKVTKCLEGLDGSVLCPLLFITLEKKLQRVVTVCKDFGLNKNLDKCVKIGWKTGGTEKIKCNNHEIKKVESFKYLGSKIVTDGSVKEEVIEGIRKCNKI
jgi:hypothetical protein